MSSGKVNDRKTINILLLGETGVGKSTLINAFVNYLAYETLDEAEHEELVSLIPCSFTLTDDDFEEKLIKFGQDENESEVPGQSVTQLCRSYLFPLGDVFIRLIDTPGIGDTRGVEQDKLNFAHIMDYIGQYEYLDCICILLKPNNSRITITFEFCIKQLLTNLQKSASKNIVFLFTNVRATFYRPGDTAPALLTILNQVKESPPFVDIPFNKSTIYCLDNEAFRFLMALKQGIEFKAHEIENFDKSWSVSAKECQRLLQYIIGTPDGEPGLTPHPVRDTVSINEARRKTVKLSEILPGLIEMIMDNMVKFKTEQDQLNNSTDESCLEKKVTINVPDETQPKMYTCRKHDWCDITRIIQARNFSFFRDINFTWRCSECGCGSNFHYFKTIEKLEMVNLFDENGPKLSFEDKRRQAMIKLQEEYDKLKVLVDRTLIVSAKLNHFLTNNSIVPYCDVFMNNLALLVENNWKSTEEVKLLQDFLHQYDKEKSKLEKGKFTITVDEALEMIKNFSLGQYGQHILDKHYSNNDGNTDVHVNIKSNRTLGHWMIKS